MLQVDHLSFSYPCTPVLEDISFELGPGQLCALLGPNGSGKTTLFKCCMRFLDYEHGAVYIDGKDIRRKSPSGMARLAAYVPQDHKASFPYPAKDIVLMGRTPHLGNGLNVRDSDKIKALNAMETLGIGDLALKAYHRLSGGQRQLVLIARALAQESAMFFLDEPTASLDFKNQLMIWHLLRQLVKDGASILVCTHDPNHVLWFCDRVIVLDSHRHLIADGPPAEALSPTTLKRIYGQVCELRQFSGAGVVMPRDLNEL